MHLYYKPGSCSLASHIALYEAGGDFSVEQVDTVAKETASGGDFLSINPNGYVPALRLDDGTVLTEGPAVLQFIADSAPAAKLAPEPRSVERAKMQQYLNFIASELHKAFTPLFYGVLSESQKQDAAGQVLRRFDYIENILSDGREFLLGSAFSVADAYLFVIAGWTKRVDISLAAHPFLSKFMDRVADRWSVQRAMRAEGLIH